ncbi:ABC transporter permease [Paenibacillus chartarius]|uniref:ABC transporter permease n=1 Tax=Paenibacillus chartarius TaxID=747481 RepID=A0ABV6DG75_9BACL
MVRKSFKRNHQYRMANWIQNIGSAVFGFVYASIWAGIGASGGTANVLGVYGTGGMVAYIAFNQSVLHIVLFLTNGLGLEQSVRTGQISLELMRPTPLFYQLMGREWGQIAYQALYKSLPMFVFYYLIFRFPLPQQPAVYAWTLLSLICAAYLSICLQFLIGIAALWTTESRWLFWINYACHTLLSGFFIPLEWLPEPFRQLSAVTPYPYIQYHTTRMFMGLEGPQAIVPALLWGAALTGLCLFATRLARRKLEVQGG